MQARYPDKSSKAHALLAIIEMEGMEIWQERETKNFCCHEGSTFSNIKLIILCRLYGKKSVMCEATTTLIRDAV